MRNRCLAFVAALMVLSVTSLVPVLAAEQAPTAGAATTTAAKTGTPPRTQWGDPDLQGIWTNRTNTPLERPPALAGKQVLTEDEAAEADRQASERNNADRRDQAPGAVTDVGRAYNEFWRERGKSTGRTSLIVDPPDGRIPPLTPQALKKAAIRAEAIGATGSTASPLGRAEGIVDGTEGGVDGRGGRADGPEDRDLSDRCIMWDTSGPPMLPTGYNSNYQILQTPEYVLIVVEMIHDARIIPLDGRPHLGKQVSQWHGNSRGHWEGNTLVVDTTNFTEKTNFRGASESLRLTERFTRVDADTINYEFTVNDPTAFARPWTAQIPMRKIQDRLYEYACHEGNHAMVGILRSARAQEKAAAEAAKKGSR